MAKQLISNHHFDQLVSRAVDIIVDSLNEQLLHSDRVVLALPGGRSIADVFRLLLKDRRVDWSQVEIFLVDERLVPITDPNSNYTNLNEHLTFVLRAVGALPDIKIHPFVYEPKQKDLGVKKYAQALKKFGGHYDVVVLGVGEDGHVGGLFPNHHSIKSNAPFYLTMDDCPKPPAGRMTASRSLLGRAKYAVALFFGEAKRQAFKNYLNPALSVEQCPVKLVDDIENSYVLTDLE